MIRLLYILAILSLAVSGWGFENLGWKMTYVETFDTAYTASNNATFGTGGWLTYRFVNGGAIEIANGYATLTTAEFEDVALIRSTDTLPDEYKIRVKVGYIDYDVANYDTTDKVDPDFDDHDGDYENGMYFLTVTDDTCSGSECAETWWHYHRKMVIDVDEHLDYGSNDTTFRPIFMVYMDSATNAGGNLLRTWDESVWDSTAWNWNVAHTYDSTLWYYAELEKHNDSITLRLYDASGDIIEEPPAIPVDLVNGMGEDDTLSWLYIGEPHSDDYKGDVRIDEISMWEFDGARRDCNGDTIVISSFPYTITTDDTCYCINQNQTSTATDYSILVRAENVLITGSDSVTLDTLYHGVNGSTQEDETEGIYLFNDADSVCVRNLAIVCNSDINGNDTGFGNVNIRTNNQNISWFEKLYCYVGGYADAGRSVANHAYSGQSKNLYFDNCTFESEAAGFYSRMTYGAANFRLACKADYTITLTSGTYDTTKNLSEGDSSAIFTDCRFYGPNVNICFPQAWTRTGSPPDSAWYYWPALLALHDSYLEVDEVNAYWDTGQTSEISQCRANSFNVVFYENASGLIKNCSLVAGTDNYGANGGIMAEGLCEHLHADEALYTTIDSGLQVDSNTFILHHGWDPYYDDGIVAKGIKCRKQAHDNLLVRMRWNKFYGYVNNNTDNAWKAYGPKTTAVYLDGSFTNGSFAFENNLVRLIVLDSAQYDKDSDCRPQASAYTPLVSIGGLGVECKYNRIETNDAYIKFGDFDAAGSNWADCWHDDTVVFLTDADTGNALPDAPALVSFWSRNLSDATYGHSFTNIYITEPHDTAWNNMRWRSGYSGQTDFMMRRSFTVTCTNTDGDSLESVDITCVDVRDETVVDGSTDANGQLVDTINIHYEEENRASIDTTYNPFIWTAVYSGDTLVDTVDLDEDGNTNSVSFQFEGGESSTNTKVSGFKFKGRIIK